MEDATKFQTDREWMIHLSGQIGTLSDNFNNLADKLVELEEKKLSGMDKRLAAMESIWMQFKGGWKLGAVIWAMVTFFLSMLLKHFMK